MTNLKTATQRISPLGLLFLTITSFGWGLNFPIMKNLLSEWPPLSSRGLCGVVGAGLLALIAVAKGQKLTVPLKMRGRLLLVSLLSLGGWIAFLGVGAALAQRQRGRGDRDVGADLGRTTGLADPGRTGVAGTRGGPDDCIMRHHLPDRRQRF